MFSDLTYIARFISSHPLTRRNRTRAFLRFAGFHLRARLRREVIVPWIEGTRLAVRRGMTGVTGNVYAGLHDFPEMAFLLHFLRPGDVFYDVGANVGSYTVLASGVCRATSLAFEPDPGAAAALRRNVEINGLGELVTVRETGVGAAEGVAALTMGLGACNRVVTEESGATRPIAMTTLDKLSRDKIPALLKIDVEGFNRQVVAGACATLASETLKAIIIEWPSEVMDTLVSFGFSKVSYDPLSRMLEDGSGREQQTNTLLVRDSRFVEVRIAEAHRFSVLGMEF